MIASFATGDADDETFVVVVVVIAMKERVVPLKFGKAIIKHKTATPIPLLFFKRKEYAVMYALLMRGKESNRCALPVGLVYVTLIRCFS